jgi:hypothetical protein
MSSNSPASPRDIGCAAAKYVSKNLSASSPACFSIVQTPDAAGSQDAACARQTPAADGTGILHGKFQQLPQRFQTQMLFVRFHNQSPAA